MGKILKVNLTTRELKTESTSKEISKNYLGGKGYAVYLLYQHLKVKNPLNRISSVDLKLVKVILPLYT